MKTLNKKMIDAAASYSSTNSDALDAGNIYSASVQVVSTGAASAGTCVLQGSNDMPSSGSPYPTNQFVPTNWTNIANATTTISGASTYLIPVTSICHQFLRVVYTSTATGVQTITTVADSSGSLNNKYFLLQTANGANKYAVWINVNGAGTPPVVSGYTAVEVAVATNATASTIASTMATALAVTGIASAIAATATVTVTLSATGPFVPAVDVDTGFTFATATFGTINARIKTINV
jgi:hypothetical protein